MRNQVSIGIRHIVAHAGQVDVGRREGVADLVEGLIGQQADVARLVAGGERELEALLAALPALPGRAICRTFPPWAACRSCC